MPEPSEKALRYYRTGTVLWWVRTLFSFFVPALFLFSGFSARLRDMATRLGRKWFFILAVFVVFYTLADYLINLPLSYYSGFVRQHAYDLSNQTFGKWLADSLKALGVGLIGSILFLWIPYLLVEKSPRRWWLYTGLLVLPFIILQVFVTPIWIAPLFNKFGPMKDKALEAEILALAARAGIEGPMSSKWRKAKIPRLSTPMSLASATPNASSCGTPPSRSSRRTSFCSSWATRWATSCSATCYVSSSWPSS